MSSDWTDIDKPEAIPDERPEPDHSEPPRKCWRCGKFVDPERSRCPFCAAGLRSRKGAQRDEEPSIHDVARPLKVVLWSFAILLTTSIIYAWCIHLAPAAANVPVREQQETFLRHALIVEIVDTIFVFFAVLFAGAPPAIRQPIARRIGAWTVAVPLLGGLLGINLLYCGMLNDYIGKQPHLEVIKIGFDVDFWLVLVAICLQPAIVEEIFFRYLALGQLRRIMGMNGAVWVSAAMFGLAHLYNPLGMPVLIVIGAGIGYMRVMSGGLLLPVLMHGCHNALVIWLEGKV